MKDNYDLSTMKRIPHPLLGKGKLVSNIGQLSEEEFEHKMQALTPSERSIAISLRKRRHNEEASIVAEHSTEYKT